MDDESREKHAYSIHQDSLLWSRTQTLIAIQSASLVGAYVTREKRLVSIPLIILAILFTLLICNLSERDQLHRDKALQSSGIDPTEVGYPWFAPISGAWTLRIAYLILLFVDIVMLIWIAIGMP